MKQIISSDNALYKSLKALNSAKGRREQGLFLAEGPHLAEEALRSRLPVRYVVTREKDCDRYAALLRQGESTGAELITLPAKLFDGLADTSTPQGILAVCGIQWHNLDAAALSGARLAVVLDCVQDPGNLGTILRTALAVDAGFAVLTSDSTDPWSQKAVRASQGAVLHLPVMECGQAADAIRALNAAGWHTACGHLDGSDFFKREQNDRTALVIGNEAAGVSPEAAEACASRWKLPMPGRAESLNAAVAAGVMLYDLWREQN